MTTERDHQQSADAVLDQIRSARDAMSVRGVYGEAYEVGGVTVIPVARVSGGAGGGSGEGEKGGESGGGFGTGFGLNARPVGVYQVRGGEVVWKPAVDVTRLARGGQVLAGIMLVCVALLLLGRNR